MFAESRRLRARAPRRKPPETSSIWRGPALTLRLATLALAAFVLTAGLALAGIRPPEPVARVLEGVGLEIAGDGRPQGVEAPDETSRSIISPESDRPIGTPSGGDIAPGGGRTPGAGRGSPRDPHAAGGSSPRQTQAGGGGSRGRRRATKPGPSEEAGRRPSPKASSQADPLTSPGSPASPAAPRGANPPAGAGPLTYPGSSAGQPPAPAGDIPELPGAPRAGHGPP